MYVKKTINFLKAFILPVVFYSVFIIASNGRMANWDIFVSILQQSVYPAIIAFSIYCIVVMRLWDLTPGAIIITSAVIGGNLASRLNLGVLGLIAFITILCIIMTLINCTIQIITRIPSMIVSCGMVMIYETISAMFFNGRFSAPREWTFFSQAPYCYYILIICVLTMYILVNRTKFGKNVRALGFGVDIASNIGVNVSKTMYKAYLLEGVMLAFASLIYISMNASASASVNLASASIGFNAIISVLVGFFLSLYCGPLLGIIIGAFTLRILGSGLLALGFDATWQKVANGIFLILFLGFSQNQLIIAKARLRKKKIKELRTRMAQK